MTRGSIRVLLALCAAALTAALMLSAGTAGARLTPPVTLKVAKHKDGPYAYDQVVNVPVGKSKSVYFKAKNTTGENVDAEFDDNGSSSGLENFVVKWFRGDKNISSEVKGSGYDFPLKANKQAILRAKLTHSDPGSGFCLDGEATANLITSFAGVAVNQKCSF